MAMETTVNPVHGTSTAAAAVESISIMPFPLHLRQSSEVDSDLFRARSDMSESPSVRGLSETASQRQQPKHRRALSDISATKAELKRELQALTFMINGLGSAFLLAYFLLAVHLWSDFLLTPGITTTNMMNTSDLSTGDRWLLSFAPATLRLTNLEQFNRASEFITIALVGETACWVLGSILIWWSTGVPVLRAAKRHLLESTEANSRVFSLGAVFGLTASSIIVLLHRRTSPLIV